MRRTSAIFTFFSISALVCLNGCGGSGGGTPVTTGPQPLSNVFTLQPTLAVLPTDGSVTISAVTPTSVTLTGAVPALKAGSTILSNTTMADGTFGLLRRVVSVATSGSTTVVQTTQGDLSDVFQTANINQQTSFPAAAYAKLKAGLPGITFGATRAVPSKTRGGPVELTLPILFKHTFIQTADGTVAAEVNGEIDVVGGLHWGFTPTTFGVGSLQIPNGVQSFLIAPYVRVGGPGVKFTSYLKQMFTKKFAITDPNDGIEWNFPLGPLVLSVKLGLYGGVAGDLDGTADVNVNGGITYEAGAGIGDAVHQPKNTFGIETTNFNLSPPNPNPYLDVTTSGVYPHAHIGLNVTALGVQGSIGIAGLGNVGATLDVARAELGMDYKLVNGSNAFTYLLNLDVNAALEAHVKLLALVDLYDGTFPLFNFNYNLHNWYTIDTGQATPAASVPGQTTGPGDIGITLQ